MRNNIFVTQVIQVDNHSLTAKELMDRKPTAMVEKAVKGMLPKNKLGAELFRNLYVYEGEEHEQKAQKPKEIKLNTIR